MKHIMSTHTTLRATFALFLSAFIAMAIVMGSALAAFAEPTDNHGNPAPKNADSYTLTWPDGSTQTYTSYEEMEKDWDQWKLLASDITSDKDGKAVLNGWAKTGTIRIEETRFPKGYTGEKWTEADLSKGEVTIINTPPPTLVKTGASVVVPLSVAGVALLIGTGLVMWRRKKAHT